MIVKFLQWIISKFIDEDTKIINNIRDNLNDETFSIIHSLEYIELIGEHFKLKIAEFDDNNVQISSHYGNTLRYIRKHANNASKNFNFNYNMEYEDKTLPYQITDLVKFYYHTYNDRLLCKVRDKRSSKHAPFYLVGLSVILSSSFLTFGSWLIK